jgi:hypothetical protein
MKHGKMLLSTVFVILSSSCKHYKIVNVLIWFENGLMSMAIPPNYVR